MALGDLTRFSEAESLVGPLAGVQELCSVALYGCPSISRREIDGRPYALAPRKR